MSLSDMFLIDDNGEVSNNITFKLNQLSDKTYEVTLVPSDSWLQNASYPVTIDPTLSSATTSMNIFDTYISEQNPDANYYSADSMYVSGLTSSTEYRGLLYFYIPSSIMNKTITYSHLYFTKYSVSSGTQINIYKNSETFASSSATWNNAPAYSNTVVDYYTVNSYTPFMFDITKSVKEWQATGSTRATGFTLAMDGGYGATNIVFQNTSNVNMVYRPTITIGYEEPSGLKDYWTYTTQDMGMVGTGYISDFTGNLTWGRSEYTTNNSNLPLKLDFYYSSYNRTVDIGYGYGWRTSYNYQILNDSTSSEYYMLTPDFNKIFFSLTSTTNPYSGVYIYKYIAEDGSGMVLTRNTYQGSFQSATVLTKDNGTKYNFDSNGRLTYKQDMNTYQKINVYYIDSSSQMINYVKDYNNNEIVFTYSNSRMSNTKLELYQSDSTLRQVEQRNYSYDSYGNLDHVYYLYRYGTESTSWSFDTNNYLEYTFDSSHKLTQAYNKQDNYSISYTYDSSNRVENILTTDNSLRVGSTDITYNTNRTIYTDYLGNSIYYTFDSYGHTINVIDDHGNSTYFRYSDIFSNLTNAGDKENYYEIVNATPNYYINNKKIVNSDVMKQQQNPVVNHGFEENDIGWTFVPGSYGTITVTDSESALGDNSLAMTNNSSSVYAYQSMYLKTGSYTLTAYINNSGLTGGAYATVSGASIGTINKIKDSDGWEKYTLSFTLYTNTTITLYLYNQSISTAYFDNIQITDGFEDTRYNALVNNSFEQGTTSWSTLGSGMYIIYNNQTGIMGDVLGKKSLEIYGNGSDYKYFRQDITQLITIGETYVVGAWGKATAVPNKVLYNGSYEYPDGRYFGIKVVLHEIDTQGYMYTTYEYVPFNTQVTDWQYVYASFTIPEDAYSVEIYGIYQGEGVAYFDNLQLYHDKMSTDYSYDIDTGNLTSIINSDGVQTALDYDSSNNIQSITKNNQVVDFDRNSTYQIQETTKGNVMVNYVYDSSTHKLLAIRTGYDKDASIQDKWFETTVSYLNDSQYLSSTSDEFGNTTNQNTDPTVGEVTSIFDALGNATNYEYDEYGNLTSATSEDVNTQDTISANYDYDNQNRLIKIHRDGYYYKINYNDLGQISSVQVVSDDGNTIIPVMSYTYQTKTGTDSNIYYTNNLQQQTYGNGDYVSFTYNDENQIQTISFNASVRFEYDYDSSGRLSVLKDIYNSNIFFYSYDLAGKLTQITDKDNNTISYTYGDKGNINGYSYEIGNVSSSVIYHYNDNTGAYDYSQYYVGSTEVQKQYNYSTDSLSRLDNIRLAVGSMYIIQQFVYDDNKVATGMGNATNRIYQINYYSYQNGSSILTRKYTYSYDNNQNITEILVANPSNGNQLIDQYNYFYDGFGQLTRENVKVDENTTSPFEATFTYAYDDQGNILHIYKYAYTTATPIMSQPGKMTIFQYSNIWKDQLTKKTVYVNFVKTSETTYTYDDSGNVLTVSDSYDSSNDQTFSWDGRQLTYITGTDSYGHTYHITYKYNYQGIRVEQNIVDMTNGQYSKDIEYTVDGSKILVETWGSNTVAFTYGEDGTPISMNYNGIEYFYVTNIQGDVIQIVDSNDNVMVSYKYDAWGNTISIVDNSSTDLANVNPFRYRGYVFDTETGYYYLQSRYYNPEIERFISSDGLLGQRGDLLSHNMYAYSANNSVMNMDVKGTSIGSFIKKITSWINDQVISLPVFGAQFKSSSGWKTSTSMVQGILGRIGISQYYTHVNGNEGIINVFCGQTQDVTSFIDNNYYAGVELNIENIFGVEAQVNTVGAGASISVFGYSISIDINLIGTTSISATHTEDLGDGNYKTTGGSLGINTALLVYTAGWLYKTITTGDPSWNYNPA